MAHVIKISLITALWYGALSALLIYVIAPWLHTGVGYNLQDGVTLPMYQKKALTSAAIGYPLLCVVLISEARIAVKTRRKPSLFRGKIRYAANRSDLPARPPQVDPALVVTVIIGCIAGGLRRSLRRETIPNRAVGGLAATSAGEPR
jgi:hypothetical protein